jgi:cytochrome c556
MKSLTCATSIASLLAIVGLSNRTAGAADDAKPASIEKIMETLHKGKDAPLARLKAALKTQSPDWAKVQKESETYSTLAADLPKYDPPQGDSASFKKLAKTFASNAKTLDEAAKRKDLEETRSAFRKIGGSCLGCHEAHKPD